LKIDTVIHCSNHHCDCAPSKGVRDPARRWGERQEGKGKKKKKKKALPGCPIHTCRYLPCLSIPSGAIVKTTRRANLSGRLMFAKKEEEKGKEKRQRGRFPASTNAIFVLKSCLQRERPKRICSRARKKEGEKEKRERGKSTVRRKVSTCIFLNLEMQSLYTSQQGQARAKKKERTKQKRKGRKKKESVTSFSLARSVKQSAAKTAG